MEAGRGSLPRCGSVNLKAMGKFKLNKEFNGHKKGETITVQDILDGDMVRFGYGEPVLAEKNKVETPAVNKAIIPKYKHRK